MATSAPLTYSIPEATRLLGISERHGYELARKGEFPAPIIRAGERYLVPRAALDRLLAGEPNGGGA